MRPDLVLGAMFPLNALDVGRWFAEWIAEGRRDRFDVPRLRDSAPDGVLETIKARLRESFAVLWL